MARYPDADILTSSDHLVSCDSSYMALLLALLLFPLTDCFFVYMPQRNSTADDGLERFPDAGSAANIGIMLVRKGALSLAKVGPVLHGCATCALKCGML